MFYQYIRKVRFFEPIYPDMFENRDIFDMTHPFRRDTNQILAPTHFPIPRGTVPARPSTRKEFFENPLDILLFLRIFPPDGRIGPGIRKTHTDYPPACEKPFANRTTTSMPA